MDPTATTPLYFDWSFWAVVVATIAIALSQVPPIRMWFKRPNLDIEVHTRILITHKVGNPNAQLHVIISNIGGRTLRLRAIKLDFARDRQYLFTLPLQNYYQGPTDKQTVLFTPTTLKPEADWSHVANFLNFFNRADERRYRDAESNLRQNILDKRGLHVPNELIEADLEYIEPLNAFFEEKFGWQPGEYEVTVTAEADKATTSRKYLFTIFESESAELRGVMDNYKYGAGIFWDPEVDLPQALAFS
jgi:hypothetical protein